MMHCGEQLRRAYSIRRRRIELEDCLNQTTDLDLQDLLYGCIDTMNALLRQIQWEVNFEASVKKIAADKTVLLKMIR